jgi:hypothetical protein
VAFGTNLGARPERMLAEDDATMLVLFIAVGALLSLTFVLTYERRVKDGSSRWNEAMVPDRVNVEAIGGG